MSRDVKTAAIPAGLILILWSSVAAWVHLGLGVSGYEIAVAHDDKKALSELGDLVRERVRETEQSFEVAASPDLAAAATVEPTPPPPQAPAPKKPEIKPPPPPAPTETPKKPEPPKPEPKIAVAVKPAVAPPVVEPPQPRPDKRIAVRQHVKPSQEDNPRARFLGDEANHVDEEQVATVTSHDRDDERPTPAGNHQNASKAPGDSENAKVAESEAHRGDRDRAPGERGAEIELQRTPPPDRAMGAVAIKGPDAPQAPRSGGDGRPSQASPIAAAQVDPAGAAAPASPDVQAAAAGGWSFNLANPNAGAGASANGGPGSSFRMQQPAGPEPRAFGLGGNPGPGRVNLNLTHLGVVAVVGQDELQRERRADGERRLSEHRGSFQASNFERWRSAIENYVASVKPGNQTALNTAASPFATYINGIHGRIHPIFADTFLGSLTGLPSGHALSDAKLMTRLEIVLTRDGQVMRMGIVKHSGVTAFDIAALDSVQRASPFGAAPGAIVSPDGNVYLHWEFHRDEVFACSTMNAHPFILNTPAGGAPTPPSPSLPLPIPGMKGQEPRAPAQGTDVREGAMPVTGNQRHS
jgi:hypothetical protein